MLLLSRISSGNPLSHPYKCVHTRRTSLKSTGTLLFRRLMYLLFRIGWPFFSTGSHATLGHPFLDSWRAGHADLDTDVYRKTRRAFRFSSRQEEIYADVIRVKRQTLVCERRTRCLQGHVQKQSMQVSVQKSIRIAEFRSSYR